MIHHIALAALPLLLSMPVTAQEMPEPATPGSVIAEAAPEEWLAIPPEDLLVMELAPDDAGEPRSVVIQLMPAPFSQPWVENIRTLAAAHWWDGTSVNRVQDNYVTQWGDVSEEKPLPEGVVAPIADFWIDQIELQLSIFDEPRTPENVRSWREALGKHEEPDFERDPGPVDLRATVTPIARSGWHERDGYAEWVEFYNGWPIANNNDNSADGLLWPIHCYGYVGVGRNYAPDTGTGAELYTIIGQPQRHMDRNLAVVGRIIDGMEHLSSLPRGSGDLGFYTEDEAHLRTPIVSVRLGSDLESLPAFEYLDTASESFARYVTVRANRNDAFYTVPAGGVDVCSVEVPVRRSGQ